MTVSADPTTNSRHGRDSLPPRLLHRLAVSAGFAAVGITVMLFAGIVREIEARVSTWLIGATVATDSLFTRVAGEPGVGFQMDDRWLALPVTVGLSGAYVLGIVFLLAAALPLMRRIRLRVAPSFAGVGVAVVLVVVQARLLVIAVSWGMQGMNGYHDAIAWTGAVVMVLAVVAAAALVSAAFRVFRRPFRRVTA